MERTRYQKPQRGVTTGHTLQEKRSTVGYNATVEDDDTLYSTRQSTSARYWTTTALHRRRFNVHLAIHNFVEHPNAPKQYLPEVLANSRNQRQHK